jgi:BCD family chlorophyll transporter-like MFS transporter
MAKRVADERRAAAATLVWMMMIASFAITATIAGKLIDPFTPSRLIAVAGGISSTAFFVALFAIWGVEGKETSSSSLAPPKRSAAPGFRAALTQVWAEPNARRFTVFVLVSMLAYSAQDLILEPFAGSVFGFTPGESTKLSGAQHGGVFTGMLLVALATSLFKGTPAASLKGWVVGGCVASGLAMSGLFIAGLRAGGWPLKENVFLLGLANGAFSIAAIGAMMALASQGANDREGVRMGLWGAAQAIAFGVGGLAGTVVVDFAKPLVRTSSRAYALVFALEAAGFFLAYALALKTDFRSRDAPSAARSQPAGGRWRSAS